MLRLGGELMETKFIQSTFRTSGLKYIIHRTKLATTDDKIGYTKLKKQEKARQIEAIIRYLDMVDEIDNESARKLLNIPDTNASYVSRIFAELLDKGHIEIAE